MTGAAQQERGGGEIIVEVPEFLEGKVVFIIL
jgi:hypothetical protein